MLEPIQIQNQIPMLGNTGGGSGADFNALRQLSRQPGGFQNNEIRKVVWPVLLGVGEADVRKDFANLVDTSHRDVQQIDSDVDRSLWKQDVVLTWTQERREEERKKMTILINAVLSSNPSLHYYQGFHDVVSVFFLVLEDDPLAFSCLEALASDFILDNMRENFESVIEFMKLIFVVVEEIDQELHSYLLAAKAEPFFSISWLLTWFAHDISKLEDIARVYDAMLCSQPSYIVYLCSAVS
jgi:hypothetical protein